MESAWFWLLTLMLTAYAVLDGFDFGAGIVHFGIAKSDEERAIVLSAIGPLWDGNEVWLLAAGGVFVFAFPRAYAAAFSGLYLAFMVVLWLLILRGLAIEVRSMLSNRLWRKAWDVLFAVSSTVLAFVFGVALGNLVRGVPLDANGSFHEDLFAVIGDAHFGAVDAFTALIGVFTCIVLAAHGATFLAWKTDGDVGKRSRRWARGLWPAAAAFAVIASVATARGEPAFWERVVSRPWVWPLPLLAFIALATVTRAVLRERDLTAFLASCAFIGCMLVAAAATLYPILLRSTLADAFTLDVYNASSSSQAGLALGLAVWVPGLALATGYFAYLFRSFRGRVTHGRSH